VRRNSSRAVLQLTRHQNSFTAKASNGTSKRLWAPSTTRGTPQGVQKTSIAKLNEQKTILGTLRKFTVTKM